MALGDMMQNFAGSGYRQYATGIGGGVTSALALKPPADAPLALQLAWMLGTLACFIAPIIMRGLVDVAEAKKRDPVKAVTTVAPPVEPKV